MQSNKPKCFSDSYCYHFNYQIHKCKLYSIIQTELYHSLINQQRYNNVDYILLLFHFSWLPTTLYLHLFIACIALYFNWLCPCILSLYYKLLKRWVRWSELPSLLKNSLYFGDIKDKEKNLYLTIYTQIPNELKSYMKKQKCYYIGKNIAKIM